MPSTHITELPLELHYAILERLRGDLKALRACSLVTRAWVDEAQRHLFHTVSLDMRNIAAFRRTVARRPDLVDHIREMTLNSIDRIPRPPSNLRPAGTTLLRLVNMHTSNPWVDTVLRASRLSVQQLSLRDCLTDSLGKFAEFLRSMPNLKNVDIERGRLWSNEVAQAPFLDTPGLQSLSLVGGEEDEPATFAVVRAIISCPVAYRSLSIMKIRLESCDLPVFNAFLQVVGPSLRELDLGIRSRILDDWNVDEFPLTLASCPNLVLLDLDFKLPAPEFGINHLYYVPVLLDTLHAPKLRRIKFLVRALRAGYVDLNNLDWLRIGQILSGERFAALRRVLFHVVDGFVLRELVVPFIEGRLNGLQGKDVLRCVHEVGRQVRG